MCQVRQEVPAARPQEAGNLVGRGIDRVVVLAINQDRGAEVAGVGVRETHGQGAAGDFGFFLEFVQPREYRGNRRLRRRLALRNRRKRQLPESGGQWPGVSQPQEKRHGLGSTLGHIDMRVAVIADDRIGRRDHPGRKIGVVVGGDDDRAVGAQGIAKPCEQMPVDVLHAFGHRRAVQNQKQARDRIRVAERPHEPVQNPVQAPARDGPGRHRGGKQQGGQVDAPVLGGQDHPAKLRSRALVAIEELGPDGELIVLEIPERRGRHRKGVGLVIEPGYRDRSRHDRPVSSLMPARASLASFSACSRDRERSPRRRP